MAVPSVIDSSSCRRFFHGTSIGEATPCPIRNADETITGTSGVHPRLTQADTRVQVDLCRADSDEYTLTADEELALVAYLQSLK